MALTEVYLDVDLGTGLNDGTSEANAWQTWAAAVAGYTAGERLNVKRPASRKDISGTATFTQTAVGPNSAVAMRGYTTTIGDGGLAHFSNFTLEITGEQWLIEGLDIVDGASVSTPCINLTATALGNTIRNCRGVKAAAGTTGLTAIHALLHNEVINCYVEWASTGSISSALGAGLIMVAHSICYGNIVRFSKPALGSAEELAGIRTDGANLCARNLVYVDRGIAVGRAVVGLSLEHFECAVNNTVDNFPHGGILVREGQILLAPQFPDAIVNNLITGSGLAIRREEHGPQGIAYGNATDGVVSGMPNINGIRLTANPYTDAANQDFTLNTNAEGGAACRSRAARSRGGFPDIGAISA